MDTILIILVILFFLLFILSISRNTHKENFNKIKTVESQDIPYDLIYDIPFTKDMAFGICNNFCERYVDRKWSNLEEEHGWKPFSYWNGDWKQHRFEINYVPKYQLVCGCNIEY